MVNRTIYNITGTVVLLFTIFSYSPVEGQGTDLKETFLEAESYFLFEEYNEALPLYLRIHRAEPSNNNINYKIGICFLNDPYQKEKAIPYLEQAIQDINPRYKENNFKETTAPPEAFFYLGNAYLVNNQIDEALENYVYFREILDEKIYDVELVEEQIRICERAKELLKKPVDYDFRNLTDIINSRFSDINPIVSGNGQNLVFVSKQAFYDATFFAEKNNGEWQRPRNIIPELGVDGDVYPTCLSWDGNTMIIYRNDDFIGNLYVSKYVDGRWTRMKKLGDNINTKYWESHACLTKDGKTLYFTSNRKGGYGGLDIYKAPLLEDGTWGEPVNLGPTINTRYNEETPFISENGKLLYFSSYGHYNMGGYDVFYSKIDKNGDWGTPINLGFPINTTDDDLFFHPVNNGNNAYYSQFLQGGFGRHDIYYLDIYSANNPRMYLITGNLASDRGEISENDDLVIYLIDQATGDTIRIVRPNIIERTFDLKAPKGSYELLIQSLTFNDLEKRIIINDFTDKKGFNIPGELNLETRPYEPVLLAGEESRIQIEDTLITAEPGEKMKIRLRLEKGSVLYADHYLDSLLLQSDTFNIDRRRFVYEVLPKPGINRIEFTMVEENGDTSVKTVTVDVPKPAVIIVPNDTLQMRDPELKSDEQLSDSTYTALSAEIDKLAAFVDDDIADIIENTDFQETGIRTIDDLFDHLEDQGIERSRVNELRVAELTGNDAEGLLDRMVQNSEGGLHEFLKDIDLEKEGITTAFGLLNFLREAESDGNIQKDQLDNLIEKILTSPSKLEKTLNEIKSLAGGDLRLYLDTLDPDSARIYSSRSLIDHLIDQVGEAYEPELMISVLSDLVNDRPMAGFVDFLVANGPPALAGFLEDIDLEKENITTMGELIAYLLNNADKHGIPKDELEMLIINLLADFTIAPILDADPMISKKGLSDELKIFGGLLFAGILIFIIFFLRRRKKDEDEE